MTLTELSERERQVFEMIAAGKAPADIAKKLGLSVKTVSTYRSRILEKLQLRSNAQIGSVYAAQRLAITADHTLFAACLCAGVVRWEPFKDGNGEIVLAGLRYFAALDADGIPRLNELLRKNMTRALQAARSGAA